VETFIVRLWTPSPELADEIAADELHGSVEHVRSRESSPFRNGDDLLELLKVALGPHRAVPPEERPSSSSENPA
jgi:hypothetical protein